MNTSFQKSKRSWAQQPESDLTYAEDVLKIVSESWRQQQEDNVQLLGYYRKQLKGKSDKQILSAFHERLRSESRRAARDVRKASNFCDAFDLEWQNLDSGDPFFMDSGL
ncbi:MAG: hypothetical protein HQM12_07655 [SAR324 cluster bacterium]|nr:hypothetical protein [SAR324 cluster bacterium]MBF0352014.1 hypothetical protein [SAR324 cluster bacterium]